MKIPVSSHLSSPFMGNYFCLIPNTKSAFVAISKNAVTFLKKVAIVNKTGKWPQSSQEAHNTVGFDRRSEYLIPVLEMRAYERKYGRLLKFAVWRDPVERIISTYKLFCMEREYRIYFHYLGLQEEISFDRFMEFLEFEWKKPEPLTQDEHIRRQVDYYMPEDVDCILSIDRLYSFLQENRIYFYKELSNKTTTPFLIESAEHIAKIKAYYTKDYSIVHNT